MQGVLLLGLVLWAASCTAIKYPIVMVPGIAGTQIEGIHYKKVDRPIYCPDLTEWSSLWLNVAEILPFFAECLAKDLSMEFDPDTQTYSEPDGVGIRIQNFGSTSSIEYLDPSKDFLVQRVTRYFYQIVEYFVTEAGYVRDVSVLGAPYDWRLSPWGLQKSGFFDNLTKLIESAFDRFQQPVILISHSLGGPTLQAYFNSTSQEWKDKYIAAWFPVEGVWMGSPKVVKALISGDNFGTPAPTADLIDMERTFETPMFLLPPANLYPEEFQIVASTKNPPKNYTIHNYVDLLVDLNISTPSRRLDYLIEKSASLQPPGVRTYCIFGTGVKTAYAYHYTALDRSDPADITYGLGDGTVPAASLEYCKEWIGKQTKPVIPKGFPGENHVNAIMSTTIFDYIHSQIKLLEEEDLV